MRLYIKKFISFILIISIMCLISTGCRSVGGDEAEEALASPLYLALGDSITTGYTIGGDHLTDKSFAQIVTNRKGLTLENMAVDGNTALGIMEQIQNGALDDKIKNAALITISCGGNDLLNVLYDLVMGTDFDSSDFLTFIGSAMSILGDYPESEEFDIALNDFIVNLNSVISYIRGINKETAVVVLTQYNPYKWMDGILYKKYLTEPVENGTKRLSDAVIDNAAEMGNYIVADVYSVFKGSNVNLCNATSAPLQLDFHPNVEGHAVIAQCVLDTLIKNRES